MLLKAETKYFPMQAVVADSRETADSLMIVESVNQTYHVCTRKIWASVKTNIISKTEKRALCVGDGRD